VTFTSRQESLTMFLIWDTMPAFLSCTSRPNAPGQGNVRFTIIQTAAVRKPAITTLQEIDHERLGSIVCSDKKLLHNYFLMKLISTCHVAKKIHSLHDKNFNYLLAVYKQQYTVNSPETHLFLAWFQSWLAETIVDNMLPFPMLFIIQKVDRLNIETKLNHPAYSCRHMSEMSC
jgi:hypothetical protein